MYKISFLITGMLLFLSCYNNKSGEIKNPHIVIDVQPFEGISKDETMYVVNGLSKIYPYVSLNKTIGLPASAFYAERNRYRADSLIRFLNNNTAEGHVTIGLTKSDISTTKDSVKDWGVIGLGYCPGKACVASIFRLSKNDEKAQLFKVAVHELGHTEGLSHCSVKTCFMRDAEGSNPADEEKEFCQKCKKYLEGKGWQFR